jgi:protein gp37
MGDTTRISWTDMTHNPWWGCARVSPACRFCLGPETRILYADMTWRPIGDAQVGDVLVGFTETPALGANRLIEKAVIQEVWRTTAPSIELSVGDRVVRASENHGWLVGSRPWWRPTASLHLDTPLRVLGDPEATPVTDGADYRSGYIAGVTAGDGTMRWDSTWRSDKLGFPQSYWRVAVNADDRPILDRLVAYLAIFGVAVEVRPFNGGQRAKPMLKVETRRYANLAVIDGLLQERSSLDWKAGWLAGIIDTDGSYTQSVLRVSQRRDNGVLNVVERYGADLGHAFKIEPSERRVTSVRLLGDLDVKLRFFTRVHPALSRKCSAFFGQMMKAPTAPVTGVKRGPVTELVDIQTSTGTFVAEGICTHNCYADSTAQRWGFQVWRRHGERRMLSEANWAKPLRWNRDAERAGVPAKVFCASMADVFEDHPDVAEPRERLWDLIGKTSWLRWQLLTKRPENVAGMVPWGDVWPSWVWLGTSVENQRYAEERIPILLRVPAKVRFLSCEPLLGPVDLRHHFAGWCPEHDFPGGFCVQRQHPGVQHLSWIITGGESGPKARPTRIEWLRSLRDQCTTARVPFFFKQLGHPLSRELGVPGKGEEWDDLPEEFRVRQFPREAQAVAAL